MKEVVRRYPNDNDAAVLYAESLMDLNPWKYWTPDGTPADGTLRDRRGAGARAGARTRTTSAPITTTSTRSRPRRIPRRRSPPPGAWRRWRLRRDISCTCRRTSTSAPATTSKPPPSNVAAARADERRAEVGDESFYLIGYYGHNLHFLAIADAFAGKSRRRDRGGNKLYDVESPRIKEVPVVDGRSCSRRR